ncbi:MAG: Lrp/AsnC family transcriptional regulator [Gammaproteobacteria bacterium]|nr:Lrp/AsnC family transcriptional regulator [Gammaproteobacteria bacterium]
MPKLVSDRIDLRILQVLQSDARVSNVELAEQVGLSPSPCARRVRMLEQAGVILGSSALVDAAAVGLPISVFIQVTLERQVESMLQIFEATVSTYPEVMECYLMTGDADYLLRVVVPDLESYQRFLMDRLTHIEGVASIKSSLAMRQVQYRTALPISAQ